MIRRPNVNTGYVNCSVTCLNYRLLVADKYFAKRAKHKHLLNKQTNEKTALIVLISDSDVCVERILIHWLHISTNRKNKNNKKQRRNNDR